jgi:hypothetical protein
MEYEVICKHLLNKGFVKNSLGSVIKAINGYKIAFVEHPFYHVIIYSYADKNKLIEPGDIKLPKKCDINDVEYVIDKLVQGVDSNIIVMDIFERLNP